MEPEEMDVVELLTDVAVEPSWRATPDLPDAVLRAGTRGMVLHCYPDEHTYDVQFLDAASGDLRLLARLQGQQLRVVERDTLGDA